MRTWVIITAQGDIGEGPWRRHVQAAAFLNIEVGVPAVVVEIPSGPARYTTFRKIVGDAQRFVEDTKPKPESVYTYNPKYDFAVSDIDDHVLKRKA